MTGFGLAGGSVSVVERPLGRGELAVLVEELAQMGGHLVARGRGRAYGDAAQCAAGVVIDCTGLDRIIAFDAEAGLLRAEAGVSLEQILSVIVPRGWFLPVTPGTRHVSLGGAIAADVHGKNHHRDGSLGSFVEEIILLGPDGERSLSPTHTAEQFWATVGGMGLTGVIVEARLRLQRIATALLQIRTERARDLDACLAMLAEDRRSSRYSVAWLDGHAGGRRRGRGVVSEGDHADVDDLPVPRRPHALEYSPRRQLSVPLRPPMRIVRRGLVAAFNALTYARAPRRARCELSGIDPFFYPLDVIGEWNRLYGPRGFTQYQFVVPLGADEVIRQALELLQEAKQPPSLVVLKRFGPQGCAPLSFPIEGWTLALDLPLGLPGLAVALDRLDELVLATGGRVYFAKDGRLRRSAAAAMYPGLSRWRQARDELDPRRLFVSDLSRRLGLVEEEVSS